MTILVRLMQRKGRQKTLVRIKSFIHNIRICALNHQNTCTYKYLYNDYVIFYWCVPNMSRFSHNVIALSCHRVYPKNIENNVYKCMIYGKNCVGEHQIKHLSCWMWQIKVCDSRVCVRKQSLQFWRMCMNSVHSNPEYVHDKNEFAYLDSFMKTSGSFQTVNSPNG